MLHPPESEFVNECSFSKNYTPTNSSLKNGVEHCDANFVIVAEMGASLQKMWHEVGEVEEAGKEREMKEKEGMKKIKLKDRLRTRILRGDPR